MNFRKLLFLPFLILTLLVSCQDEATEIINPLQEDIIEANSTTASLMSNTASNDGSLDNIIDYANCLEVVLPVTITVNGVTITIESFTDYEALEAILDAFTNDADEVVITFPITVTLNDYTTLVINSQAELEAQIANCNGENEDDDDIECIDFQYPIVVSIYNTDFQVTETVTIENDEQLYLFLDTLNGPVIASLNFPVTLVLANGETTIVNNNQELEVAITEAEDDCDEDDDYDYNDDDFDCNEDSVELALTDCFWHLGTNLFNNVVAEYYYFEEDYTVSVYNSVSGNLTIVGTWSVSSSASALNLTLNFDTEPFSLVALTWEMVDCDDDQFEFVNGNNTMVLEQDCNTNNYDPFECFEGADFELVECDDNNDGFAVFDLTSAWADCINPNDLNVTYHETISDAQQDFNAIAIASNYTNSVNPQTIYIRVELFNNPDEFEVFEIHLIVEDCTTTCTEADVVDYLETCHWITVNLDGSDNLVGFDLFFNANNDLVIINGSTNETYSGYWNVSSNAAGNILLELANINGPNIQAISGFWDLVECDVDRLEFTNDNNVVFVIEQDCN